MTTPTPTVLLVGHCGFDSGSLQRQAQAALPDATITTVNTDDELTPRLSPQTILLVNRVLDGHFAAGSGIDLIAAIAKRPEAGPCLLISNFEDAQEEAIKQGAAPGFGKNDIGTPLAAERLQAAAQQIVDTN
ncbi:hypothetical protein [Mucisphaera sp.]|uniref:hypothetical protein n=1 Tax=Mucisphaera sp. TaxID=2913024 RepID=UPI003D1026D5